MFSRGSTLGPTLGINTTGHRTGTWGRCFCTWLMASTMQHGRRVYIGKNFGTLCLIDFANKVRFMGAITNNSRKLANFAGFYKGIQSGGAAIAWRLNGMKKPYMNMFASCWVLLAGSLIIALPVMILKIKDTVPIEEDLQFTDEIFDNIVGPASDYDQHLPEKKA